MKSTCVDERFISVLLMMKRPSPYRKKISIPWLKGNRTTIGYILNNNSATDVAVIQMFNPSVQSLSQILDSPITFHNYHD